MSAEAIPRETMPSGWNEGDFWTSLVIVARQEQVTSLAHLLRLTALLERECERKRCLRWSNPARRKARPQQ